VGEGRTGSGGVGGGAIGGVADRVGQRGGTLATKLRGAIRRGGRWLTSLPARVGRLLVGLLDGLLSLRPWSPRWWTSLADGNGWTGLLAWLGLRVVEVAEVLGVPEILETAADFIRCGTRPLAGDEIAAARRVFGDSIDYALVRIDEGAIVGEGVEARLGRLRNVPVIGLAIRALIASNLSSTAAYVTFHTINTWGAMDRPLLLHELTHVWQYERMGAVYMPLALRAQATGGYDYGGVAGLVRARREGTRFTAFNLEQQGDIVRDFYRLSIGDPVPGAGRGHLSLYAHFVQEVSTHALAHLSRGASCAGPEPA
jgi:hypothetical protein